jgi:hypothetical protein
MALDKEMTEETGPTELSEEDELGLEIAVLLAKRLIDDGGAEVVEASAGSSDQAQVIGQFLMQLGSQMMEQIPEELKASPAIMLCEGGWVEQVSDFLQEEYDIPREVMDRAEIFIGTSAEQMAQGQQQPGGPAGPAATPAAPQPAMPQAVA